MNISLRPLKEGDDSYFQKWWKDADLLAITSGSEPATEEESTRYFQEMLRDRNRIDRMIVLDKDVIGHIAFLKKEDPWWEFFIVIGDKESHGKGYGKEAVSQSLLLARTENIHAVFLEVRPENVSAKRV